MSSRVPGAGIVPPAGGGASLPVTSALLKGDGSGGAAAATAGTDYPGLATANTFTRGQFIDGGSNEVQLAIEANATQTANLMEWRASGGTRGAFVIPTANGFACGSGDYRMEVGNNGLGLYSALRICWGAAGPYNNPGDMFNVADAGLRRAAAKFVQPTDGNANTGGGFEFVQIADGGTPSSNAARIYAKDNGGTAEIYVKDEAGNETQISPHAANVPFAPDLSDPFPHVVHERNAYVGVERFINVSRLAYLLQAIFPHEKIVVERDLPKSEWLDWDAEQNKLQARYDAERAAEIEAREKEIRQAAIARRASLTLAHMRAEAKAAGETQDEIDKLELDPEFVAKLEPFAADLEALRAATPNRVRPKADIRKPAPAWLKPRMAEQYDNTRKPQLNWKQRLFAWLMK